MAESALVSSIETAAILLLRDLQLTCCLELFFLTQRPVRISSLEMFILIVDMCYGICFTTWHVVKAVSVIILFVTA